MSYSSNKRPKPKPPQNNVMTISKALKAVNDNMDWTVLFIALLLVMVWKGTPFRGYLSLLDVSLFFHFCISDNKSLEYSTDVILGVFSNILFSSVCLHRCRK